MITEGLESWEVEGPGVAQDQLPPQSVFKPGSGWHH